MYKVKFMHTHLDSCASQACLIDSFFTTVLVKFVTKIWSEIFEQFYYETERECVVSGLKIL